VKFGPVNSVQEVKEICSFHTGHFLNGARRPLLNENVAVLLLLCLLYMLAMCGLTWQCIINCRLF